MYDQGEMIRFNIGTMSGIGKVCGKDEGAQGTNWVLEIKQIAFELTKYPYTHIVANEKCLIPFESRHALPPVYTAEDVLCYGEMTDEKAHSFREQFGHSTDATTKLLKASLKSHKDPTEAFKKYVEFSIKKGQKPYTKNCFLTHLWKTFLCL